MTDGRIPEGRKPLTDADIATQPDPLADPRVAALVEAAKMWMASFDTAALFERDHSQSEQADAWRATETALAALETGGKADE